MTSKQLEGVLEGYSEIIENYTAYICAEKREEIGRSHQYSGEHVTNISKNTVLSKILTDSYV